MEQGAEALGVRLWVSGEGPEVKLQGAEGRKGMNDWRGGNLIGAVYMVEPSRLGLGKFLPRQNTLALCVEHSGDCFYDYVPLRVHRRWIVADLENTFGSYIFSKESSLKLTNREFHLLLAGEKLSGRGKRIK